MSISVLILTKNEERNLPACLASVSWSDDVVVLDSHSTDRTAEIALAAGARVYERTFDNERDHRTASLRLPFRYRWVYNPDADEITTPGLASEMRSVVGRNTDCVAWRVRRKDMFRGRWLRHASLYPTWVARLFRPECISFEREINLTYKVAGPEGRLKEHLLHYSFTNGIEAWFAKHNVYSSREAVETIRCLSKARPRLMNLASHNPVVRRTALKELSCRMPMRPILRFLYSYICRRGFLDGSAGFHYSVMLAIYEYLITMKVDEVKRGDSQMPITGTVPR